ncbi:MAG: hypothetical protein M3Y88_04935 [Chloroflexota bacterium]|nr:hypothetical protein [Chloroflexota bacterium]
MLCNIECHSALAGDLDGARRLWTDAFQLRPDIVAFAPNDPDLVALHGELAQLAEG